MADWTAYVRRRLRLPALRGEREAEIVEDLARQLDDAYREALAGGATDAEARAQAEAHIEDWDALARQLASSSRQRLSASARWQARADDRAIAAHGRLTAFAALRQDLGYGIRVLAGSPAVAIIAILSLALGMGANTAIFSVMDALLFRTLPVRDPASLVVLSDPVADGMLTGLESGERSLFSYHEFEGLRDNDAGVLSSIAAFSSQRILLPVTIVGDPSAAAPADIAMVTGGYFGLFGVDAAIGRTIQDSDDRGLLQHPVAVLSHTFWRSRFRSDPAVLGRTIQIRHTTFTVVGVAPPAFTGAVVGESPDVFVPLTMQQALAPGSDWLTQPPGVPRRVMFLHVVGRLAPGVTLAQANASLNLTFTRLLLADGGSIADPARRRNLTDAHLVVRDARDGLSPLRGDYTRPLAVLMTLVGLLLLLACANVANLLLARATGRQRELAMRAALGASRARLMRQLLTESLMLAAAGAATGLALAHVGARALLRLVSDTASPVPLDVSLDLRVLAFTVGVAILTGLLFGLWPAVRATRTDLEVVLRGSGRAIAGTGRARRRWPYGKILAAAQAAISLILLVTAGLFLGTLRNLTKVSLGYDAATIIQFRMNPEASGYAPASAASFFDEMLTRVRAIPGVVGATLSANGLFYGADSGDDVSFPGSTLPPNLDASVHLELVGPRYFSAVGIPVLAGRDVTMADGHGVRGCWLNQAMAKYFFPAASPIGREMVVHFSFGDESCEIRGIVGNARSVTLRGDVERRLYAPFVGARPNLTRSAVFQVRVVGEAAPIASAIRQLVRERDPSLDPPVFHTLSELLAIGVSRDRLTAWLSTVVGLLALVLAAIGLYGVLSYSVTRRVSEIGVRMALGARRERILLLFLREALETVALGVVVGVASGLAATRYLENLLFGLTPHDPAVIVLAASALVGVAMLAALIPAWRASRTDPLVALRE